MTKFSLSALVAAGLLAGGLATSANAADLGGNCCADLEERIAELEATTARKGNRKVSLTVSGWVGQQISFWDDGTESNAYVHDLGTTLGSHVKFTGSAQISAGWSAGYVLQIEAISSDSLTISQDIPNGPALYGLISSGDSFGTGVHTLQSYWFIKSDHLGKLSLGKQSQASDNTAILVDGSGSLVPANWVAFDSRAFFLRNTDGDFIVDGAGNGLIWGGVGGGCATMGGAWGDCNGLTQNVVRYDTPTFGGFSLSASWGEDDMWDIAGRYAGEHHGFKLAVAVAYNEVNDQNYNNLGNLDAQYFQAGVYLQHVPTGLFGLVNYGHMENETFVGIPDSDTWYVKGGLRTKFNHLGATIFYGEYLNAEGNGAEFDSDFGGATDTVIDEVEVFGLGIVQEIDAAAMSVWIKYRHLSADTSKFDEFGEGVPTLDDFDYVGVGGLINF